MPLFERDAVTRREGIRVVLCPTARVSNAQGDLTLTSPGLLQQYANKLEQDEEAFSCPRTGNENARLPDIFRTAEKQERGRNENRRVQYDAQREKVREKAHPEKA